MGGYTSKCEKKSKSLHPNEHADMVACKFGLFIAVASNNK
jgi:hypothetical protein